MKQNKIIHIYGRSYNSYFPGQDSKYYYLAGWASNIAINILKYDDGKKYTIGAWRFEKGINKQISKVVDDVECSLFPAKIYPLIGLWSFKIIKAIKREMRDYNIVLHLHKGYDLTTYLYFMIFNKLPIIVSNYGSYPPIFSYKKTKKIIYLLFQQVFRIAAKYCDYFIVSGKNDREYLKGLVKNSKISDFTGIGINFDKIKPVDKIAARKLLGIPVEKKVLVYVGKMYETKGVHNIIAAYKQLLNKYDVKLVLIGASADDPLYTMALESGADVMPRMDRDTELPLYYSAADVYLMANFEDTIELDFAGIGIAPLECIGCNTPVVSPTLKHFPENDLKFVGKAPETLSDFTTNIEEIFDNPDIFKNCRKYAKQHFGEEEIANSTLNIYDKLINKYYNKN